MVNNLNQKFGSAVRIIHRGWKMEWDTWRGSVELHCANKRKPHCL
jgi:hypothetical protein